LGLFLPVGKRHTVLPHSLRSSFACEEMLDHACRSVTVEEAANSLV
jgi:hypothetical protein